MLRDVLISAFLVLCLPLSAQRLVRVGEAWAATSVNTAVFRNASIVSADGRQYTSYYDAEGYVTLAARTLGDTVWTVHHTRYKGNVSDGHNVISIGLDGTGRLHVAFDHHGHPLHYARATAPGALTLGPLEPMTGEAERDVTYPEFYTLPSGDMLFAYRSGASGRGNLVLKRYDVRSGAWSDVHKNLIDGEGQRNAYWQMYVDGRGWVYLSWVWRETWLVETNHDLCYALSKDGGRTWQRSDGTPYTLPITEATAERAWAIPQRSELINQTSMTADAKGRPYIATYWRSEGDSVPQYRLVWHDGRRWRMEQVGERKTPFTLAGGGTKMIPIARPRIASDGKRAWLVLRDAERGSRVSVAYTPRLGSKPWAVRDLTTFSVGAWEPSIDNNLWNKKHRLHVFVQPTSQGDGERVAAGQKPTTVSVLELN